MYLDNFPAFIMGPNRPQHWDTFLRARDVLHRDERGKRDFFNFALREEINIGNFRKISEEGGII